MPTLKRRPHPASEVVCTAGRIAQTQPVLQFVQHEVAELLGEND